MLSSLSQIFCSFSTTFNGKKYEFPPVTIDHVSKFTSYLEKRVLDSVEQLRSKLPHQEFMKLQLSCLSAIACEKYAFPSEAFFEALATPSGIVKFLHILSPQYTEEELLELVVNKANDIFVQFNARVTPPPFSENTPNQ